jgi:hypothetical protein
MENLNYSTMASPARKLSEKEFSFYYPEISENTPTSDRIQVEDKIDCRSLSRNAVYVSVEELLINALTMVRGTVIGQELSFILMAKDNPIIEVEETPVCSALVGYMKRIARLAQNQETIKVGSEKKGSFVYINIEKEASWINGGSNKFYGVFENDDPSLSLINIEMHSGTVVAEKDNFGNIIRYTIILPLPR